MDGDIAYVGLVNNRHKVWTMYSSCLEWAQCGCPIACENMICKHTMKVFKMLHLNIKYGVIVKEAGTLHGVDRTTPMSQCYTRPSPHEGQPIQLPDINNDMHEQVLVTIESKGYNPLGDPRHRKLIDSQDPPPRCGVPHNIG